MGNRYKRKKNIIWRKLGKDFVVIDLNNNNIIKLNETGEIIWLEIAVENGVNHTDLVTSLLAKYQASEEAINNYVKKFIYVLTTHNLIEVME